MAAGSISDIEFTDYVEKFISLSQKTHDTWELKRLPVRKMCVLLRFPFLSVYFSSRPISTSVTSCRKSVVFGGPSHNDKLKPNMMKKGMTIL